jgi:hypothetical protein
MKTIIDYYIEYSHPEHPDVWQRTYDYYRNMAEVHNRINEFKKMDYMRDVVCRVVERTQTFELKTS